MEGELEGELEATTIDAITDVERALDALWMMKMTTVTRAMASHHNEVPVFEEWGLGSRRYCRGPSGVGRGEFRQVSHICSIIYSSNT